MFAQLHAYPVPAHVLAIARNYFNLSSVNSLKEGILTLRDCAAYASKALSALQLMKVDKYQLQLGEMSDYVLLHAKDYGFGHLSTVDLHFVTYLITSSESQQGAWTLDLQPNAEANLFSRFLSLYQDLAVPPTAPVYSYQADTRKVTSELSNAGVPIYYSPLTNKLIPLTDFLNSQERLEELAVDYQRRGKDALSYAPDRFKNEATLYLASDVRLLDHVFMLLMSTEAWDKFLAPRDKVDPSQNVERAKGLRLFAAYLQSLLLYPHMFRFEAYREGYRRIEEWHGSVLTMSPELADNYAKHVTSYDFLNASLDVKNLCNLYSPGKDEGLQSTIHPQFIEMASLIGVDEIVAAATRRDLSVSQINLQNLKDLNNPKYDPLLLSLPLQEFRIIDDIQNRVFSRHSFAAMTEIAISFMIPGYNRYISDDVKTELSNLKPTIPFPWHQGLATSAPIARGSMPIATKGKWSYHNYSPWATTALEHKLRNSYLYSIGNADGFVAKHPIRFGFDDSAAAALRTSIARSWRTFYPADVIRGERLIDGKTFTSNEIELKRLLELITGDPYPVLVRSLFSEPLLATWATILSSFALLYRGDRGTGDIATAQDAIQVVGKGAPWGSTYEHLGEMQQFDAKTDFVKLPNTNLYIAFLKRIPVPTDKMEVGVFHLAKPYYYFSSNSQSIEVTGFTSGESMLQFAVRPIPVFDKPGGILFDRTYAYANDSMYLQVSADAALPSSGLDDYFSFNFQVNKKDWKNEKTAAQLELITVGSYLGTEELPLPPAAGSEDAVLTKMMNEIQQQQESSASQASTAQPTITAAPLSESAVATAINEGK
jgi:hypothetical protein